MADNSSWADAWSRIADHEKRRTPSSPPQFKLRTLLAIMFGIACFLGGWCARELHQRIQEPVQVKLGGIPPSPSPSASRAQGAPVKPFEDLFEKPRK